MLAKLTIMSRVLVVVLVHLNRLPSPWIYNAWNNFTKNMHKNCGNHF